MAGASKSVRLLPAMLLVVGLFFLMAGLLTGGPDMVGGFVFGGVSLAASAAIFQRRVQEAAKTQVQAGVVEPGAGSDFSREGSLANVSNSDGNRLPRK